MLCVVISEQREGRGWRQQRTGSGAGGECEEGKNVEEQTSCLASLSCRG